MSKMIHSIYIISLMASFGIGQGTGPPIVPNGPTFNDFLRFSCSELNVQRIDP